MRSIQSIILVTGLYFTGALKAQSSGADELQRKAPTLDLQSACDSTLKEILKPLGGEINKAERDNDFVAVQKLQKAGKKLAEIHQQCRRAEGNLMQAQTRFDVSAKQQGQAQVESLLKSMHETARSVLGEQN